ncbi:NfeD family protein [soil metagenome]
MEMNAWMFWILLAVILAAGEVMTLGLFLAPFAAGAVLGAAADLAGAGAVISILVFLISSGLFFVLLRPVSRRQLRTPAQLRTGTAALVGKTATVTTRIDAGSGAIKLEGEIWTARPYDGDAVYESGRRVHVVEIQGATALVIEG